MSNGFIEEIEFIGYELGVFVEDGEVGTVTYTNAETQTLTGTTVETQMAAQTIPGGLLKANSVIEIELLMAATTTVDDTNTAIKIYFGNTVYAFWGNFSVSIASPRSGTFRRTIYCNNSVTAQKGSYDGETYDITQQPITTSSENTAEDVIIAFKGVNDNNGVTLRLEGYRIKLNGV